ncbi:hypothetical protein ACHHYP_01020 [Achlya hypogyna]|uniref:PX domain-containing protein n=1 Tax=Achlya hypogyna TaxID=1202772 RepID=A0A1V9Z9H2_ACHHY|nr:hypothetical protein ACHHYP_01020 [Achlya hypogyna]
MNVSALITGHETVGDHTEFIVQISCSGVVWLISRRFSDFDQLHCRLESVFQGELCVRLPEKQWFGRFDPGFLTKRQAGLQLYLDGILQIPGITDDRSLQHFFEAMEKNVELHSDLNHRNSQSLSATNKHLTEAERWLAIVDKTAHALIDISEVPEPLEVEQANQKRAEIIAAWAEVATPAAADSGFPALHVASDAAPVSFAASTALLQDWHTQLAEGSAYQVQPPSEELVAVMADSISVK